MTGPAPAQEWWTSAEIAAAALPDMARTRQGVELAAAPWRKTALTRRRAGRGGGWEYHWTLFPIRAQQKLLKALSQPTPTVPAASVTRDEAWTWFEGLPDSVKARAALRLRVIQAIEAMEPLHGKHLAVHMVARAKMASSGIITATAQLDDGVVTNTKISGAIQSDNWVAGSVGWRIAKGGTAEFNNLIVRGWLQVGAVSDRFVDTVAGPFFVPDAFTVRATLDLGAQPATAVFKRGAYFEARQTGPGVLRVVLQRRSRELGGAFSLWTTIEEWNTFTGAWAIYSDSGTLVGGFDDFEYRLATLVTDFGGGGPNQYVATNLIRNINLVALEVAV